MNATHERLRRELDNWRRFIEATKTYNECCGECITYFEEPEKYSKERKRTIADGK